MKKTLFSIFVLTAVFSYAQDRGYFFGSLESNTQWLLSDKNYDFPAPKEQFRGNNYLQLNYSLGKFTAGIQYESYLPVAISGYSPTWDGENGIATYYLNYRDDNFDITAGYFYEQFGSGLILRTWEDRQLGINNALKGIRVKYSPASSFDLTGVYGQTRNGFDVSKGTVQGLDANLNLSRLLAVEEIDMKLGASYVGRYQDNGTESYIPASVNAYGGRFDFTWDKIYGGVEAIIKDPDVLVHEGRVTSEQNFDGTALLVNLGYAQRGLGINATFRRLENFSFYSDRYAEGNQYNEQLVNYVPAITKQHDYFLSNIYVYNAQPRLLFTEIEKRAGEVGTQVDMYYTFDRETALGKAGTKITGNFSYWQGLDADFNFAEQTYDVKFIGKGDRYFRDLNFQIENRWSSKWNTVVSYQDVIVDKGISEGGILGVQGDIRAQIVALEGVRRFGGGKALTMQLQHLWTADDDKNWAAASAEYNFNPFFAVYALDAWNYGGEKELHFYNFGGSYSKGNTRFALSYGRQRGGLICVGGVCREVPKSTGFTANLVVTF